jgi:hypothetical protein
MTQPVQSTSPYGYSYYDPTDDMSRTEGTGGSPGLPASVTEGSRGAASGAESEPSAGELQCLPELLNAAGTCASAYLARQPQSTLSCVAATHKLLDCLTKAGDGR